MALGGQLQILTQPISDSAQLRAALESIQPGDGHASFGELGRAVRALAETVRTPIDVHLYSDMQRTAMPANFADLVLPANVTLDASPRRERDRRRPTGPSRASTRRRSCPIRRIRITRGFAPLWPDSALRRPRRPYRWS